MRRSGHLWAIILAAGEGRRLGSLTRDDQGSSVPKQYCAFDGSETMLRWTVKRAARVVPVDQIVTVVAAQHRRWWRRELFDLPPENVVAQPRNKGTAVGLLLPLTEVLKRDPLATVVVLPSDHHVADEKILQQAILAAFRAVDADDGRVVLLGIAPRDSDADYGWIMTSDSEGPVQRVASFVEKPAPELARRLMEQGGLLNSMIIAASGATLLRLYARSVPLLLDRFTTWRDRAGGASSAGSNRCTSRWLLRTSAGTCSSAVATTSAFWRCRDVAGPIWGLPRDSSCSGSSDRRCPGIRHCRTRPSSTYSRSFHLNGLNAPPLTRETICRA